MTKYLKNLYPDLHLDLDCPSVKKNQPYADSVETETFRTFDNVSRVNKFIQADDLDDARSVTTLEALYVCLNKPPNYPDNHDIDRINKEKARIYNQQDYVAKVGPGKDTAKYFKTRTTPLSNITAIMKKMAFQGDNFYDPYFYNLLTRYVNKNNWNEIYHQLKPNLQEKFKKYYLYHAETYIPPNQRKQHRLAQIQYEKDNNPIYEKFNKNEPIDLEDFIDNISLNNFLSNRANVFVGFGDNDNPTRENKTETSFDNEFNNTSVDKLKLDDGYSINGKKKRSSEFNSIFSIGDDYIKTKFPPLSNNNKLNLSNEGNLKSKIAFDTISRNEKNEENNIPLSTPKVTFKNEKSNIITTYNIGMNKKTNMKLDLDSINYNNKNKLNSLSLKSPYTTSTRYKTNENETDQMLTSKSIYNKAARTYACNAGKSTYRWGEKDYNASYQDSYRSMVLERKKVVLTMPIDSYLLKAMQESTRKNVYKGKKEFKNINSKFMHRSFNMTYNDQFDSIFGYAKKEK